MGESSKRGEQIKQLHQARKAATKQAADAAIGRLAQNGKPINFHSVAAESGLSKSTLYNTPEIRRSIENLRGNQPGYSSTVQGVQMKQSKDAVIAAIKRKMKKLEQENSDLKKQIKVCYAKFHET